LNFVALEHLDEIMLATVAGRQSHSTLLVCFFTGVGLPKYCAPMLRDPAPALGSVVQKTFHRELDAAISLNSAVHDGAVILGRNTKASDYAIRGWSFRLFPPATVAWEQANHGSAFNSGVAMSAVAGMDAVYLASGHTLTRWVRGDSHVLPTPRGMTQSRE
jgi:hypothetical protein